jgi:hypothetical protein
MEVGDKIMGFIQSMPKKTAKTISVVDFSAGDGRLGTYLLDNGLDGSRLHEFDIDPKHERIKKQDWLALTKLPENVKQFVLVLNPPFGKACHTACLFLEHALQLPDTQVIAAFLILPLYPIVFTNTVKHEINLLAPNSFSFKGNEANAPACLHEVHTRPSSFLSFHMYTTLSNRPYYKSITDFSDVIAHDTRHMTFTEVQYKLPIGLIRKSGVYAGLTALVIEKDKATLYAFNPKDTTVRTEVKPFNPNAPVNERPWMSKDNKWHLTSFGDDDGKGGERTGCAALKILPKDQTTPIAPQRLHTLMNDFVSYVGDNRVAVRGGGNGPKSIGIGTFYWITHFALNTLEETT